MGVGFLGQAIFTARFLVQWAASEKRRDVGRAGGVLVAQPGRRPDLLAYTVHKQDPPLILGQAMGLFVYVRNLMLVAKAAAPGRERDGPSSVGAGRRRPTGSTRRGVDGIGRTRVDAVGLGFRLGGEAEEAFDGEADVVGAHQGLADEDGGDAGGFEALDVAAGADAALADERDVRRDRVAEPEGLVEVGDEPRSGRGC